MLNLARLRFGSASLGKKRGDDADYKVSGRVAKVAGLKAAETETVRAIELRAALLAQMPVSHLEALQVLKYSPGGWVGLHNDAWEHGALRGTRRLKSVLIYLTTNSDGATRFPNIGLKVLPVAGDALAWANYAPNGKLDPLVLHDGDVASTEKVCINCWFRSNVER